MLRCAPLLLAVALLAPAAEPSRSTPITAGDLTVLPRHILAAYRPAEQQAVTVWVGRPGQTVQAILFTDARRAAVVFDELWGNTQTTKDPGDEDARPLTRMMPKGTEDKPACLIANTERILAIARDPDRRSIRIYFDLPFPLPLNDADPAARDRTFLELDNSRDQADTVLAAYKASVYQK